MNALKPEIIQLYKQRQQHQTWLIAHGKSLDEINRLLEQWSHDNEDSRTKKQQSLTPTNTQHSTKALLPHQDSSTWLLPELDRVQAEKMLAGKTHGTFLIRKSRDGRFALSIVNNGEVGHCHIHQTERGFGFSEPYNIYPSLKDLVLHYAQNSLEEHNEKLKTTLTYPVGANSVGQVRDQMENTYIHPDRM